jgi:hypothetical protein
MILFPTDTPTMTTMFSPTLGDMTRSQDESAMNYARPALNTGTALYERELTPKQRTSLMLWSADFERVAAWVVKAGARPIPRLRCRPNCPSLHISPGWSDRTAMSSPYTMSDIGFGPPRKPAMAEGKIGARTATLWKRSSRHGGNLACTDVVSNRRAELSAVEMSKA